MEENIAAYKYLEQSGFSCSLTGKPHSTIRFDQMIEITINRSCKRVGGLSRNTQNPGATERWRKVHHQVFALREYLNQRLTKRTKERHIELGTARFEQDEEDARNIIICNYAWLPDL